MTADTSRHTPTQEATTAGIPVWEVLAATAVGTAGVLALALSVLVGVIGQDAARDHARTYQDKVKTALMAQYDATASAASATRLPRRNASTSNGVTLKVAGTHQVCSVETATGPTDLIVICAGTELPHR